MHIPRWSFPRANWPAFSAQCELQLGSSLVNDIDKSADNITETLISAATNTIPKTKPFNKPFAPWWNKQCSAEVKASKHAFKYMQRYTTPENVWCNVAMQRYTTPHLNEPDIILNVLFLRQKIIIGSPTAVHLTAIANLARYGKL